MKKYTVALLVFVLALCLTATAVSAFGGQGKGRGAVNNEEYKQQIMQQREPHADWKLERQAQRQDERREQQAERRERQAERPERWAERPERFAICTIEGCDISGPHQHDDVWYCGTDGFKEAFKDLDIKHGEKLNGERRGFKKQKTE